MSAADRGPRRAVRRYLGDQSQTTGRAELECGHVRAVPKNGTWYYCGACKDPMLMAAAEARARAAAGNAEVVELPVYDGAPVRLARVLDVVGVSKRRGAGRNRSRYVLSDGATVDDAIDRAARGELVRVVEEGGERHIKHYGEAFARAWLEMPQPPRANVAEMVLKVAGFTDMPSEALQTWLSKAVREYFKRVKPEVVADVMLGASAPPTVTVGEVLSRAVAQQVEGRDIGYWEKSMWYTPVAAAVTRWLRTQNLIAPDLSDPRSLPVPVAEVWRWDRAQREKANARAGKLREAVAERFGFVEVKVEEYDAEPQRAWVRCDFKLNEGYHDLKQLAKQGKSAAVTEELVVLVNGQHRCVVEAKSADLPHDDQVVRRMLALATTHREQVSTLQGDVPLLEELFTPYKGARVWDLAGAEEGEEGEP